MIYNDWIMVGNIMYKLEIIVSIILKNVVHVHIVINNTGDESKIPALTVSL